MNDGTTDRDRLALGRALRALRDRTGITQKEMTASAGLDDSYISRVEHGQIDVKWSTLLRFLRVFDADLHQLADAITAAEKQDAPPKR